ncbi:MAG: glycosyltransferase family 39 protein [Vicinamibacterales bacterium]
MIPAPGRLPPGADDIDARTYRACLLVIAVAAVLLRGIFPLADPPWQIPVGVVWHDEGAWTHNARNMALFGAWETDRWNPMYLAPVFNALEYASFRLFGVGLWQARLVSEVLGFASVLLVAGAVRRAAGRTAGAMAGALMATNFVWVMWNRAALLETAMVVPMTAALYAYARADRAEGSRAAAWGALAAAFAVAAFFSKAAAAFFPVAIFGVAASGLLEARRGRHAGPAPRPALSAHTGVLLGLAVSAAVAAAVFVIPYWTEFTFYNWQMSVTRKPSYTWEAFVDRASWLPVVHDFFTRQWMLLLLALGALFSTLARWRASTAVERLSVAWILVGCAELIVHDVGNERRFVFLVPPLIALAAVVMGRDRRLLAPEAASVGIRHLAAASPLLLYALYVLAGSAARVGFDGQISPGVRLGAAAAVLMATALLASWPRPARAMSRAPWPRRASVVLLVVILAGDVAGFVQWTAGRTSHNYQAMRSVAGWLPPGTLVHGKLANGLALESRIRPVFVGRGFGNYDDRLERDDVRYVLTYTKPYLGYEGRVIQDVLRGTRWRVVRTFRVAETTTGDDEAALIEKLPREDGANVRGVR